MGSEGFREVMLAQAESTLTNSAPSTSSQKTLTLTDRQAMLKSKLIQGQQALDLKAT